MLFFKINNFIARKMKLSVFCMKNAKSGSGIMEMILFFDDNFFKDLHFTLL